MEHSVKIVAHTVEATNPNIEELNKNLTIFSGKAAGVCYMPDDYMENGIQDAEKAFKRALNNSKSGHHSVYDHGHLSLEIKSNKMICMILNSLGVYATSEKSARYTKMQPETELELEMYNKWKGIIQNLILTKYPNTDDSMLNSRLCKKLNIDEIKIVENGKILVTKENFYVIPNEEKLLKVHEILTELKTSETLPSYKLAMENARYMISVFTPTSMMYTVSFRQMFLILDYMYELAANLDNSEDDFNKKLLVHIKDFIRAFEPICGELRLHDNKNQYIRFLEAQHIGELVKDNKCGMSFIKYNDLEERLRPKKEVIGDSYTLVYYGSLAMLAQAQRHRTIRYTMCLRDNIGYGYGFYTPEIIKDAGIEDVWQEDMRSVAYCYPQGTLVRITEQGLFEDFALKCKERMCGRAQLEIMKASTESIKKFIENKENLSYSNLKLLETITIEHDERDIKGLTPCARCMFKDFKCSEWCQWGPKEALTRCI